MKRQFDILFESVMKELLSEQSDFSDLKFDNSKFRFMKDENDNVICNFSLFKDNDIKYIITARHFGKENSFSVTDEDGVNREMTEKEFSEQFYDDYEDYMLALNDFEKKKANESNDDENGTKVDQFSDVLKNEKDGELKDEKMYEIDGIKFIFGKVDDQAVSNYHECQFQIENEGILTYVKVLLLMRKTNSLIIKFDLFTDEGTSDGSLTNSDFEEQYEDDYIRFKEALKKYEKYVENFKDLT